MDKIILTEIEPNINADSEELSKVIVSRVGLTPRKVGSTENMYQVLIQIYEKSKIAYKEKKPSKAIITVEEMAAFAGITRQTMYDYLKRWLMLNLIIKTSYVDRDNKVVIGYKLNGNTLESGFEKVRTKINNNLEFTLKYVKELQKVLKNEKISKTQKEKKQELT